MMKIHLKQNSKVILSYLLLIAFFSMDSTFAQLCSNGQQTASSCMPLTTVQPAPGFYVVLNGDFPPGTTSNKSMIPACDGSSYYQYTFSAYCPSNSLNVLCSPKIMNMPSNVFVAQDCQAGYNGYNPLCNQPQSFPSGTTNPGYGYVNGAGVVSDTSTLAIASSISQTGTPNTYTLNICGQNTSGSDVGVIYVTCTVTCVI